MQFFKWRYLLRHNTTCKRSDAARIWTESEWASDYVKLWRCDDDNSTTKKKSCKVVGRDFPMSEFLRSGTISWEEDEAEAACDNIQHYELQMTPT